MHPVFSIKRFIRAVLCMALMIPYTACSSYQSFTLGEWIQELVEETGIDISHNKEPYFETVTKDSPYFAYVQSATEYGILDPKESFDTEEPLTRLWLACTVVRFAHPSYQAYTHTITDLSDSYFKEEVETAVSIGLMKLDEQDQFNGNEPVKKEEADEVLKKARKIADERIITETKTDITFQDDLSAKEISSESSVNDHEILVGSDTELKEGEYIHWISETDHLEHYGRIMSIQDETDGRHIIYEDIDLLGITERMELSGSTDVDFTKAEIIGGDGVLIQSAENDGFTNMASYAFTKSFNLEGYKVTLYGGVSGLKAEVKKELATGAKAYANIRVGGVHCDYEWLSEEKNLKDVYVKVKFDSEQNAGVNSTSYKKKVGDFSKLDPKDFVNSIRGFFVNSGEAVEKTLTLAKVRMPVPNAPLMNIQMSLDMTVYVSGKIELTFHQSNVLGCEIRNGHARMIHSTDPDVYTDIKASTKLLGSVNFALLMTNLRLCDLALQAGAEAYVLPVVHLYEGDKHTTENLDAPLAELDELASENENVLVCADYSAKMIGQVKVNSSSTILGKFGLIRSKNVFSDAKYNLVPEGYRHMENMQFVKECTRKDRKKKVQYEEIAVSDKIRLERYALAVPVNGYRQINVTGLPEGYSVSDLIYESRDTDTAVVSSNGRVTGKVSGSCEVTVTTNDGKYSISLSVLVKAAT